MLTHKSCRGTLASAAVAIALLVARPTSGLAQERAKVQVPGGGSYGLALSPDGTLLARPENGGGVVLWNMLTENTRHILKGHTNIVKQLTFSANGTTLIATHTAMGQGGPVSVVKHWDVATGREKLSFVLEGGGANRALSPDGRLLVTVQGYPNKIAKVWDLTTKEEIVALEADSRHVSAAAVTADGKVVALGGSRGEVKLWDLPSGKPRGTFKLASEVAQLQFSPDGRLLAARGTPSIDGCHFWDVASGKEAGPPLKQASQYGCFSPDGKVFAYTIPSAVQLWSVARRTPLAKLTAQEKLRAATVVVFSPDGRLLARADGAGTIVLWDVPSLKP